ncbi:MAG: DNA translocase FtsK, partial [Synergistaceae bacterium]|nr:DNA translocase FtsK [Synergistaceae bacterium]
MTHLVIAGAAASGKSVFINNCIMSMCSNNSPESLKLILIDPKRVDFAIYDGLPHLIAAPVADSQKASEALLWAVNEMERRVKLFADLKVRNLAAYNFKIEQGERLARIVIIIDEPGDLLYISSAENNSQRGADELIDLLIRKAGPAGIHLIIATQRPSINLIANIIKTNIAARAAFKLTSQTESRLFAGVSGAEKLQGRGDMLYISPASQYPVRLQTLNSNEKNILEFIALMRKKI